MIVIVAPYSPPSRSHNPHLGAARKIEAVVSILGQLGMPLVLVNTAHAVETPAPMGKTDALIAGVALTEITPQTYSSRPWGKLFNLLDVPQVADCVLALGKPALVWLYNGYAMESRLGVALHQRTGCPIVQEMEDWHFSRGRGLNPKPFIDWWFWRKACAQATHVFAVNGPLAERARQINASVSLFPGVVSADVAAIQSLHPPFASADGSVTVGYFGGLSAEKGADCVLALCNAFPPQYKFIATGAGALEADFARAASQSNGRFEFHGRVDDETLSALMGRCDVLLNPHAPIAQMANGIFPFKVVEAVASGRLLVSTPLPGEDLADVLQGVFFTGHDVAQFHAALLGAREWFLAHQPQVEAGASAAVGRFGTAAILDVVKKVLAGQTT